MYNSKLVVVCWDWKCKERECYIFSEAPVRLGLREWKFCHVTESVQKVPSGSGARRSRQGVNPVVGSTSPVQRKFEYVFDSLTATFTGVSYKHWLGKQERVLIA